MTIVPASDAVDEDVHRARKDLRVRNGPFSEC
jgi:hypothetical protein